MRVGRFTALVDGGGTPRGDFDVGAGTVVPALRALGVFDLDVVVATHPDLDHVEGLASVLRLVPVGELWLARAEGNGPLGPLLVAARERGVRVREVRRGDRADAPGVVVRVLWPPPGPLREEDNENSVVLRVDASRRGGGTWRALLSADLPATLEGALGAGRVDLLKVGHHGSRFSTGEALLRGTRPRDAVVSVGRNTYGHPNPEVLDRLRAAGARVWRTDESGALRFPVP